MWHQQKLANGLRLITVSVAGTKAITVLALFGVGSRSETLKENGISHFIEHMMFKGTERRPTTLDLSRELDSVGAEFNAYTSRDHTGYYIKVDAQHSLLALDMLSDMLTHSKFDSGELDREKGVIVEEINMYQDNPTMYVEQLFEETLFANHPLGRDIAGEAAIVKKFDRPMLLDYRDKFYIPRNGIVVLAGRIDNKTKRAAVEYFGKLGLSKKQAPAYEKFKFGPGGQTGKGKKIGLKFKETDQTHLVLGFPGLAYDDAAGPATSLLNLILGGTMSSRLFIEIRERRGLAYMIRSDLNRYHETGNFLIQAGLDSRRTAEAVKVILDELVKIKKDGVTKEELQRAKDNLRGHMVLSFENSSAQAEWYAKQALLMKKVATPEERLKKFTAIKAEEIQKAANQIFDFKKLRLAVIGPYKTEETPAGWLKI